MFQKLVEAELRRARAKFPRPQASRHEGLSVLEEEVHEARLEVYNNGSGVRLLKELVQVAAMAQRMAEETLGGMNPLGRPCECRRCAMDPLVANIRASDEAAEIGG